MFNSPIYAPSAFYLMICMSIGANYIRTRLSQVLCFHYLTERESEPSKYLEFFFFLCQIFGTYLQQKPYTGIRFQDHVKNDILCTFEQFTWSQYQTKFFHTLFLALLIAKPTPCQVLRADAGKNWNFKLSSNTQTILQIEKKKSFQN